MNHCSMYRIHSTRIELPTSSKRSILDKVISFWDQNGKKIMQQVAMNFAEASVILFISNDYFNYIGPTCLELMQFPVGSE